METPPEPRKEGHMADIDATTLGHVRKLVNYLYEDEMKDWENEGYPIDHIGASVATVADWLDGQQAKAR
jgi:hypothetical protein